MFQLIRRVVRFLLGDRDTRRRIGKVLSHPVTILALATVAAVWLTNYYQERAWVREKKFEIFRQGHAQALELIDELSDVMSRRSFSLNRVVWVAKGTGTGELEQVWKEYYQTVEEWNTKLLGYQYRLLRSVGPDIALALGSWDDTHTTNPWSIHDLFFQAHQRVRTLVDCVRDRCAGKAKATALQEAEEAVNQLGLAIPAFIQGCTDKIHEHANAD